MLLSVLLLFTLLPISVFANEATTSQLSFQIGTEEGTDPVLGEVFPVNVVISGSDNVYGVQYEFQFDSSVLELVNPESYTLTTKGVLGEVFDKNIADLLVLQNGYISTGNDSSILTQQLAVSYQGEPKSELLSSGKIATYYFRWVNEEVKETSLYWINNSAKVIDENVNYVPVEVTNQLVKVQQEPTANISGKIKAEFKGENDWEKKVTIYLSNEDYITSEEKEIHEVQTISLEDINMEYPFYFQDLPLGAYKLMIDGPFYKRVNQEIILTENHVEDGLDLGVITLESKKALSKVHGTIYNLSGNKVQGAYISVWEDQGYYWNEVITDGNGSFSLDVPYNENLGSEYYLNIWHEDYLPYETSFYVNLNEVNLDSPNPIALSQGNTATGTIINTEGTPITDVAFQIFAYDLEGYGGWANATSSPTDGSFSLNKLTDSSNYLLEIYDPTGRYVNQNIQGIHITNGDNVLDPIMMKQSAKVEGSVLDFETSIGIKNTYVTVYNPDFSVYGFGRTDENGKYQIKGLGVTDNNKDNGFVIETYNYQNYIDQQDSVNLEPESTVTKDFQLYKKGYNSKVFSNPEENYLKVNKTVVSPNEAITYQIKYKNNNQSKQAVENASIQFAYPKEATVIAATRNKLGISENLVLDDVVNLETHTLTVNFEQLAYLEEGIITVQVRVKSDLNQEMTLSANAKGFYGTGESLKEESLGSALTSLAFVTFKAPNATSTGEVTVYGEAMADAEVYIYEGKADQPSTVRLLATAKTNGKYWSKKIKLTNSAPDAAEEHVLFVRSKKGDQWSNPSKQIKVLYDATIPKVSAVVINAGWNKDVSTNPYIGVPSLAVTETTPITIDFTFEGSEKIAAGSLKVEFLGSTYELVSTDEGYQVEVPYGWRGAGEESIVLHYQYQLGNDLFDVELPLVQILILIDPSGNVTDKVTGKPIQGIKATAEIFNETDNTWYMWEADKYGQVNPQYTDAEGHYGWDVPEGLYRVRFVDPNGKYLSTIADDNGTGIIIPPPRTDVHVQLVKNTKPEVENMEFVKQAGAFEIQFNVWMDKSSVDESKIVVKDSSLNVIPGKISFYKTNVTSGYDEYSSVDNAYNVIRWTPDEALIPGNYNIMVQKEFSKDLYGHQLIMDKGPLELVVVPSSSSGGGVGGSLILPDANTISEEIEANVGGAVELAGVAKVVVPAGALPADGTINITKVEETLSNNDLVAVSSVVEITSTTGNTFVKPIMVSLVYNQNEILDGNVPAVYYYNESKEKWVFIGGDFNETEQIITFNTNHLTKFAVFSYAELTLKDLNNHWANQYSKRLIGLGVINGFANQTFMPDENVTRAQFAKMLVEALNLELNSTENLATVFADNAQIPDWAKPYILTAYNNKLILGYEGENGLKVFKPDQLITRAEMAVMIARGLGQDLDSGNETTFADDNQIPFWAKSAININFNHQIINGYQEDNTFRPNKNATRAEAAKMIYMLLEALHY